MLYRARLVDFNRQLLVADFDFFFGGEDYGAVEPGVDGR